MRRVTLDRVQTGDDGTFGYLKTDSGLVLRSGELPWRDNLPNRSCIPAGEYSVVWAESPAHGWVYHVIGVSGRTDVELHKANYCGDITKFLRSDLKGCITLGISVGPMNGQLAVLWSYQAFKKLYADLNKQQFRLRIIAAY